MCIARACTAATHEQYHAFAWYAGDTEDALKFLQQQQVKDSTLVSSVYLDDSDFDTYRSRLATPAKHLHPHLQRNCIVAA